MSASSCLTTCDFANSDGCSCEVNDKDQARIEIDDTVFTKHSNYVVIQLLFFFFLFRLLGGVRLFFFFFGAHDAKPKNHDIVMVSNWTPLFFSPTWRVALMSFV